ncbi:MAG: translation elongation factor Ts [bacterium]
MKVDTKDVIKLRKETDIPILECRQALEEAKSDFSKAKEVLKERSKKIAAKKASRVSDMGIIEAYIHNDNKIGVLVEVSSETDFVAKNSEFKLFVHDIAMQIAATNPKDVKQLLTSEFIKDLDLTIGAHLRNQIVKIGENIKIKRFIRYELGE